MDKRVSTATDEWERAMESGYDGTASRTKPIDCPLGVRTNMTYDGAEPVDRPIVVDARPADASTDQTARPAEGPAIQ